MRRIRVIPTLLLMEDGLYKTVKFKHPTYIGDPINTVKIFNEKEVDELVLLDIQAGKKRSRPNFTKITEIAGEAFMPMAYGGGIISLEDAKKVFDAGFEKVIINTALFKQENLIEKIAKIYGNQSVVVSIDVKKDLFGRRRVFKNGGTKKTNFSPEKWAKIVQEKGAGEILLNAIYLDGTWAGYDLNLIKLLSDVLTIPLVVCGGARNIKDFASAVFEGGASAVAAGSLFIYQKKGMGVLVNYPSQQKLKKELFLKL